MLKKMISFVHHRKQIITIIMFLFSLTLFLVWVNPVLAFELSPPPQEAGLPALIVWLLQLALIISGFVMVGILIVGGFQYFFSTGRPKEMIIARNKILKSLMGLALLLIAFSILYFINPELVDRERPFLEPVTPMVDFEFFIVPEIPEVEANTTYALEITSLATGRVFRVSYNTDTGETPAHLTRLKVLGELDKKIDGLTDSPVTAEVVEIGGNLDIVLKIEAKNEGPEGGFSLANDGKGILETRTIVKATEGNHQLDVVTFPLMRNKIVYVEPRIPASFSFYLGWITEEYLYRNLLNPPVRCEWSVDIPEDIPATGIEISKGGLTASPGPHLLNPLGKHQQRVVVNINDPLIIPLIIEEPIKFHLRCYNQEGMGITKTVSIEVRLKTIYYRVPTGKIIEWAIFDRNARTRFDEIEEFIVPAVEQSNDLIEESRKLIDIIRAGNFCGMTTDCGECCVPPPPQLEMWVDQGRYDVDGDGTLDGELYNVWLMTPACDVQRADPGDVLEQSLEIERVLLSPDEPCGTFKPLKNRREAFWEKVLPIELEPPKSIIYPPTPNVPNHSGAFDHWRVKPDEKWTNFLFAKRKIEAGRDELRRYLNSLQLAAFLMSAGCKNHPEFPMTHHQLLPEMVRDPFRDRKDPHKVVKEVKDIIGEMREMRIDDLVNWTITMEDSYHVYVHEVDEKLKKIENIKEIRNGIKKNIKAIENERRMAVQRIRMENPPERRIFTIFEYDPFTFYCPEFYQIPRITNLKRDTNQITNIKFGPKPNANPSSSLMTHPSLNSIFKLTPDSDFSSDFIRSHLINHHHQNSFVILENETIAENQIAILTSGAVDEPKPKAKQLLYLGDVRMHEIPSGQAVEEAIDLLTKMDRYLTTIIEAMPEQEEIALELMRLAYDDFNPADCHPICIPIYIVYVKVGCMPLPCVGSPYNISEFERLLRRMESEGEKIRNAQEGIRRLLHDKEEWETIWFFPREVTRIEKIEALTEQTRALMSVCPVRPRGKLYHEYGGKPTGRPTSCVKIREKILAGEAVEGVYAVTDGLPDDGQPNRNCFEECRPPKRETQEYLEKCLDCLRAVDITCRLACLNDSLGDQCLACIPCQSLKNYFCFFLEERFYPK